MNSWNTNMIWPCMQEFRKRQLQNAMVWTCMHEFTFDFELNLTFVHDLEHWSPLELMHVMFLLSS